MYEIPVIIPTIVLCMFLTYYLKEKYDIYVTKKQAEKAAWSVFYLWGGISAVTLYISDRNQYRSYLNENLISIKGSINDLQNRSYNRPYNSTSENETN